MCRVHVDVIHAHLPASCKFMLESHGYVGHGGIAEGGIRVLNRRAPNVWRPEGAQIVRGDVQSRGESVGKTARRRTEVCRIAEQCRGLGATAIRDLGKEDGGRLRVVHTPSS